MGTAEASPMEDHELQVVAVVRDAAAIQLLEGALVHSGDRLSLASELADGLSLVTAQVPDVALIDVTLGDAAGLAVVHHIRALSPQTAVFAITRPERLELGMQAMALGSAGTLVLPLSGDDVLTALSDVRLRRAERAQRARLMRVSSGERAFAALAADVTELGDVVSRRTLAERLSSLLRERLGATRVLVYLGAGESSRQLMRTAASNPSGNEPPFCDELELLKYAKESGLEVVRIALRREQFGLILVGGLPESGHTDALLSLTASLATLVLVLVGSREQSNRGAMKDPESSAYTFAYFVDVAGREIDMARRHGRRFALATIAVQTTPESAGRLSREPTVEAAERVLGAVRDTDVLARVDANEFYLLLPETGGLGAQACRRRVLDQLGSATAAGGLEVVMGLATFPHDGADLSRLLRVAKHRADASAASIVERFGLDRLALPDLLDALLGRVAVQTARAGGGLDAPRYIELPAMDAIELALSAVREAARAGEVRVIATQHAGISIGAAVRAEVMREIEGVRLEVLDVSSARGAENADVLLIVAQHASYALIGRSESNLVRAVHGNDPRLTDILIARLSEATGTRLLDG
jgi:ActR/RegA family two-component response regulator/GGDEF domain-containing protein